jgi:CHAT domain-containing protein
LLQARGDLGGAERHYRDALAMHQRLLSREAGLLAEADALNLAASFPRTRDGFLSVTRGRVEDAADYDLLWQGRSALTRLAERRHRDLLASHDPATRQLSDRLLIARQRLARRLLAPAAEAAKHAAEVRKLTAEKEELEQELARRLRLDLPPAGPPPAPARLAERLPVGAVFLDFYRYTHFTLDPKKKGKEGEKYAPNYVAFVLGKDKTAVRVELGAADSLEKAWAEWHRTIVTPGAPYERERKAAAAVALLAWDPIRKKLPSGTTMVYLAPDQALTQLPWAALPGKTPDTVLLEQYAFATVPHGPFLLDRLAATGPAAERGALLAVGGVNYATPSSPGPKQIASAAASLPAAGKAIVWKELKGTGPEAERVTTLAKERAQLEARLLTGPTATTSRVLAELGKTRYAHLATHGFFADAEFRSAFQVDAAQFDRLTPDRRGGARSPLVLSGLVFAGANSTGKDAAEDRGILTAEAIVGLRLDKLELAVLSACDTGLGEVGGGEGVYGLQRAFHVAGCKNVVASLWEVGDKSTAALMTLFYRNLWERKLGPMQSLREAQLELFRHPAHMDDFSRSGKDWTPRPLYKEAPPAAGARARTAQWAAFTFSGVAAPPKKQ